MIRIGCIGNIRYENKRKIKETLFELKTKYGNKFEIITGGRKQGAEPYIKKYALEFAIPYGEYNPAHTTFNLYSKMPEGYYNRPFQYYMNHQRNTIMSYNIDGAIIFRNDKTEREINHMIKCLNDLGKPYKIIN